MHVLKRAILHAHACNNSTGASGVVWGHVGAGWVKPMNLRIIHNLNSLQLVVHRRYAKGTGVMQASKGQQKCCIKKAVHLDCVQLSPRAVTFTGDPHSITSCSSYTKHPRFGYVETMSQKDTHHDLPAQSIHHHTTHLVAPLHGLCAATTSTGS